MILSKSEFRVAKLAVLGLSTKDIAEKLFVTESCIKAHLRFIYKKMNCTGRSQLIARHGLAIQSMELPEIMRPEVQFDASRDRDFTVAVEVSGRTIKPIESISIDLPRGTHGDF